MLETNKIYNCNCIDGLKLLDDNSVDLTVTSPPYDLIREYHGVVNEDTWNFDVFKPIAKELYRVTRKGGVVVWVVGDAVVDGGETGSSFRQALYFQECGFKLHDTMIYEKNSSTFPARADSKRYSQIFEYMFVFVKGKIRNDIKLIADKKNKWFGWTNWGQHSQYDTEGNLVKAKNIRPIPEFSLRTNIWKYSVSFNDKTGHPAVFPEKLAEDHILSWSCECDLVLDPFMGSGTTAKMAMLNNRNYIGFELNKDYYEKSLERVAKYEGKVNDRLTGVTIMDEVGEGEMDLQCDIDNDKEIEGKTALFAQLLDEMNKYFNEQSLGILKNLKLTFVNKANDERVKKVMSGDTGIEKKDMPKLTIPSKQAENNNSGIKITVKI
jgi:site-specific DNA-methyltransferase (adenine-specific)